MVFLCSPPAWNWTGSSKSRDGLSVSFTWNGALHTRGTHYIFLSEGMRTFLEDLLCARPKSRGLLGYSASQGNQQAQNAAWMPALGTTGWEGLRAALGKRQGSPRGSREGSPAWGNRGNKEFEAGHIWWQHGLGQKGFECAQTLSMGEQGRFWSRACGTRELYRDGSVVGAGE